MDDESMSNKKTAREHAKEIKGSGVRCNCDLDNWEQEARTGHSHVCRIHKLAIAKVHLQSGGRS